MPEQYPAGDELIEPTIKGLESSSPFINFSTGLRCQLSFALSKSLGICPKMAADKFTGAKRKRMLK